MGEGLNRSMGQPFYLAFVSPRTTISDTLKADCPNSATFDYSEERAGERASSIGEVPYFDPESTLRKDDLKAKDLKW